MDLHTGRPVKLAWLTEPSYLGSDSIRVQTYRDVARRHLTHSEAKAAGPDGQQCGPATTGTLQRLHLYLTLAKHIGKESQDLEEVQAWLTSPTSAVVQYPDVKAEWEQILKILKKMPLRQICDLSGLLRISVIVITDFAPS